ncbi:galactosylceramidase [Kitasatospora indigofera]|uniref:galactosylceramidase n=1 Tax=Kitasatospora indigofera TaxID=67307 RepID=A0A919FWF9_9ACTN|nr:RICIN domain-containing protein [Kitasatospora indigofera]GHH73625.1 galactosylceramidase [Kitasatospora indigofera]
MSTALRTPLRAPHRTRTSRVPVLTALALCWSLFLGLSGIAPGAATATAAPVAAAGTTATATTAAATTAVTVDGGSAGRVFDGVGAISGGGGNTRLLYDYPEPQRSQVFDHLFKPGYGAALQLLKVEIGGDTNSTDGAESSHEHTRGAVNCLSGYEWWVMEQAKLRNPDIKLYALSWGAPGWIGNGKFWSQDMIGYLMDWLGCARQHHLTVDYLGGWNEREFDAAWYKNLRATLNAQGYAAVKVVGADDNWDIATAMRSDSALAEAVDIVGVHYPCKYRSAMTSCASTPDALATGKQLWAAENGSDDANAGAPAIARGVNRGYLDARMTGFLNWPLVASIYQNLSFNTMGLVVADQPWSGAYTVGRSAWATAHTTQFTEPGWHYLDTASGYLGGNRANGSYVSYRAPDGSAWSTVLETMDATAPQTLTLRVAGGLPGGTLRVWSTDLSGPAAPGRMVRAADLTASSGTYTMTLRPGRLYTLTTTTGQGAGAATGPARSLLALPYADTLAGSGPGQEARYFSTMNGAFETAPCAGGRSGTCLRQQAPLSPIRWTDEASNHPYTLMGGLDWADYTVSADALLEQSGTVELLGRAGTQRRNNKGLNAYHLRLSDTGAWSLTKSDSNWAFTTLASGTVAAPGTGSWHRLALAFAGRTITARIDGTAVGTAQDGDWGAGQIGLGTGGYQGAQFADLEITPGARPALDGTYTLVDVNSGKVLDASGRGTADGTPVIQWDGNGGANQQWRLTAVPGGYCTVTGVASGKVLAVAGNSVVPGAGLNLRTGDGSTGQQWLVAPSDGGGYLLESRSDGQLADPGGSTAAGAQVVQQPANGKAQQRWKLVPVTGAA